MLRIHFTAADLRRIRVASAADPMWEIALSLHILRARGCGHGAWRRQVTGQLPRLVHLLAYLSPPRGNFADFLTPDHGGQGLEAGIDAVLSTRPRLIQDDLDALPAGRQVPSWTRSLAGGDAGTLRLLGQALRDYHDAALRPFWARIEACAAAERARLARCLLDGGVDQMLGGLHPSVRWSPPVLDTAYPVDRDVHLDGRGLLLVPSYFCSRTPVTLRDPHRPPVLVYPAMRPDSAAAVTPAPGPALAALLGRTRAVTLAAIGDNPTTGQLAQRIGASEATASRHATALRNAGLIVSRRNGAMVTHSLTPLGRGLRDGSQLRRHAGAGADNRR